MIGSGLGPGGSGNMETVLCVLTGNPAYEWRNMPATPSSARFGRSDRREGSRQGAEATALACLSPTTAERGKQRLGRPTRARRTGCRQGTGRRVGNATGEKGRLIRPESRGCSISTGHARADGASIDIVSFIALWHPEVEYRRYDIINASLWQPFLYTNRKVC